MKKPKTKDVWLKLAQRRLKEEDQEWCKRYITRAEFKRKLQGKS